MTTVAHLAGRPESEQRALLAAIAEENRADLECPDCEGSGIGWCDYCGDPDHAGACSTCEGTGIRSTTDPEETRA